MMILLITIIILFIISKKLNNYKKDVLIDLHKDDDVTYYII
jgi:hypothetical protein